MKELVRKVDTFLGMDEVTDASNLYVGDGKAYGQVIKGFHVGQNENLDGSTVGAGATQRTWSGYPISLHRWEACNGSVYWFAYVLLTGGTTKLEYCKDSDTTPTALLSLAVNTDTAANNWYGSFTSCSSTQLYFGCSKHGVYRIDLTTANAPQTTLTNIPATSFPRVANNRMWTVIGDETIVCWSAVADYERFIPRSAEVSAGTYDIDYRYTFTSQGAKGSVVGHYADNFMKLYWTTGDCFVIVGDGNSGSTTCKNIGSGYGMNGFDAWTNANNIIYFNSSYDGGRFLGLTTGPIPPGGKYINSYPVAKNFTITIFDAVPTLKPSVRETPAMNCVLNSVVWDSKTDFSNIGTGGTGGQLGNRTGWDVASKPGLTFPGGLSSNAFASATVSTVNTTGNSAITAAWNGSKPAAGIIDGYPVNTTTNSYGAGTYGQIDITGATSMRSLVLEVTAFDTAGNRKCTFGWSPSASAWGQSQAIPAIWEGNNDPYNGLATFQFHIQAYADGGYTTISFTISPTAPIYCRVLHIYDLTISASTIKIGEVWAEGSANGATTLISDVRKINGIIPAKYGKIIANIIGSGPDRDGGVSFYYRAQSTTFTYDATPSPAWSSAYTLTQVRQGIAITAADTPTDSLFVQWKLVTTATTDGNNIIIDSVGFYFPEGNVLKSLTPVGHTDDRVFMCQRTASTDSYPIREIVKHIPTGQAYLIPNKYATCYHPHPLGTSICQGVAEGYQFKGMKSYYGLTPTQDYIYQEWSGPEDKPKVYGGKISVGVNSFVPNANSTGLTLVASSGTVDVITPLVIYATSFTPNDFIRLDGVYTSDPEKRHYVRFYDGSTYYYEDIKLTGTAKTIYVPTSQIPFGSSITQIAIGVYDETGYPWDQANGSTLSTTQKYQGSYAVTFDADSYVYVPSALVPDFGTEDFEWSGAFRPASNNQSAYLFFITAGTGTAFYLAHSDPTGGGGDVGKWRFKAYDAGTTYANYVVTSATVANTWYYVVLKRSGSTISLTVNGTALSFTISNAITTLSAFNNYPMYLVYNSGSNGAYMDNVKLTVGGKTYWNCGFETRSTVTLTGLTNTNDAFIVDLVSETGATTAYSSSNSIANDIVPKSKNSRNTGKHNKLYPRIRCNGETVIDGIDYTIVQE